ncbi:MAG: DUF6551 family protein [Pigmentiphaga sp.]
MSDAKSYRRLKPLIFSPPIQPPMNIGERAELCLLQLDRLVVDDRYQRAIGKQGRPNIQRILAGFDWRKFTPVVVTPVGDGFFAIIDGQHRATAALMHPKIDMVPCMVINVTPEEAAACFAAINGCVTKITQGQIWKARLTAGDKAAAELKTILDSAEVRILPYKVPNLPYKVGDTIAIATLERMLVKHGANILNIALQAVTQSGTGNPGCLIAPVIIALCQIVEEVDVFQVKPTKLFDLMDEISLSEVISESSVTAKQLRRPHSAMVKQRLSKHLMGALGRSMKQSEVEADAA